mmetsp:Transcript_7283/g.10736  ORF Transcript_7283/g.10736 Transcript_7283/m.10736 type:complete len:548 (-) Transcript_7283:83-1726(-)|eukprot:CAMPEP_0196813518 /NCGR_PEP_ID=MMETSP1362-20130617/37250_1 /TAXON_ID=163516 /ORGANISM="Leptocylindrus danicus, Strain CCMP1856" /LENGTH=547 /DNA_ID=CAMNT_0042189793 /DNA_START=75 /DNA_END=1718 /DNA_ORIENTATION=+
MTDTILHELCKGFGALLTRAKSSNFPAEASRANERGNLPLHAAASFQAPVDAIEALIKANPSAPAFANGIGNLPIHHACMWQAPPETVELLLAKHPTGATVRNQYGSLPLHMAASNQATPEVIRLLIENYPDALHLQNDDGMTPLDLALADGSASEAVVALLQGRPPPAEPSKRQQAEALIQRAEQMEGKLSSMRGGQGRQRGDLKIVVDAIRKIADRFPHALYAAGVDPDEIELALEDSNHNVTPDEVILDVVKRRVVSKVPPKGSVSANDRVETVLKMIVGLYHLKSQIRGLRRTMEINDLRESILAVDIRLQTPHMVFVGNPGSGKTYVGRFLAKILHELGIIRKAKFVEVERMDLVARDQAKTRAKTREVLDDAKGGILFVDEAYTLGMHSRRHNADLGNYAIAELIDSMDHGGDPLIISSGFPTEMQSFLASQMELKRRCPLMFEFPDYDSLSLAQIFVDLATTKGFELGEGLTPEFVAGLLEQETTKEWRSERNGRLCEQLLASVRTEVRRRIRRADVPELVDPHLVLKEDVENVITTDFK